MLDWLKSSIHIPYLYIVGYINYQLTEVNDHDISGEGLPVAMHVKLWEAPALQTVVKGGDTIFGVSKKGKYNYYNYIITLPITKDAMLFKLIFM